MPVKKSKEQIMQVQIWVLERVTDNNFLPPALDEDGTDNFLAWPTEEQAKQGLLFQIEQGYIEEGEFRVARVYPTDFVYLNKPSDRIKKLPKDT